MLVILLQAYRVRNNKYYIYCTDLQVRHLCGSAFCLIWTGVPDKALGVVSPRICMHVEDNLFEFSFTSSDMCIYMYMAHTCMYMYFLYRTVVLGVVGQSNPSGAPTASSHVELPSPHPASGVLVRPIPQQPSPVRVSLLYYIIVQGGWGPALFVYGANQLLHDQS